MADIKISELPVATAVSDSDIVVINQGGVTKTVTRGLVNTPTGVLSVANGGTGVAVSSGASSVVLRDANQNITANSVIEGFTSVSASGTQIVLTVASTPSYLVTGSGGQTIKLPDATTLQSGVVYLFNNNQSSGAITVNNNSNTLVASVPSGGFTAVSLLSNSIAAGSWERHEQAPSNVTWSTNTLDYAGSITSATWNGVSVAVNRGGTGAADAATALANLGGVKTADIQAFTASGTWTKPAGAKSVLIQLISSGGGGGSGRKDTTLLTARGGGGGGGGGNIYEIIVPASILGTTEAFTIGAGGIGGAGVAGPVSNGTAGTQGGTTSFGFLPLFQVPGAFGGGGGSTAGGTGGSSLFNGNSGGNGGLTSQGFNGLPAATNIVFAIGGGGGAGGGPVNVTDTAGAGGVGGLARISNLAGGAAGANTGGAGGAGVAVTNASSGIFTVGSGGGGGGAGLSVSGGVGGVGGFPGGGGGGGGATRDGTTSGAGANGANGIVIITTYF